MVARIPFGVCRREGISSPTSRPPLSPGPRRSQPGRRCSSPPSLFLATGRAARTSSRRSPAPQQSVVQWWEPYSIGRAARDWPSVGPWSVLPSASSGSPCSSVMLRCRRSWPSPPSRGWHTRPSLAPGQPNCRPSSPPRCSRAPTRPTPAPTASRRSSARQQQPPSSQSPSRPHSGCRSSCCSWRSPCCVSSLLSLVHAMRTIHC